MNTEKRSVRKSTGHSRFNGDRGCSFLTAPVTGATFLASFVNSNVNQPTTFNAKIFKLRFYVLFAVA